jgi:hypothetical protein
MDDDETIRGKITHLVSRMVDIKKSCSHDLFLSRADRRDIDISDFMHSFVTYNSCFLVAKNMMFCSSRFHLSKNTK